MPEDLTDEEKSLHTDLALAYLHREMSGEILTFNLISEFTGIKRSRVQEIYASALNKLRKFDELKDLI